MLQNNLILNPDDDVFVFDDSNTIKHRNRIHNDIKISLKRLNDAIENHYLVKEMPSHFFEKRKVRKSRYPDFWQFEKKLRGILPARDRRKMEPMI